MKVNGRWVFVSAALLTVTMIGGATRARMARAEARCGCGALRQTTTGERFATVRLWLSDVVTAVSGGPAFGMTPEAKGALTVAEYLAAVDAVLFGNFGGPTGNIPTTAKGIIEAQRDRYQTGLNTFLQLNPPPEVRSEHRALLRAYAGVVAVLDRIAGTAPDSAPATEANAYIYTNADNAYAVNEVLEVQCALNTIANSIGVTFNAGISCENEDKQPKPESQAIGTRKNPVASATLTHEPFYYEGQPLPRVYYQYDTIYAKAGEFTLTFINNNQAPFLFNLAIYRGNAEQVRPQQLLGSTAASSGPGVTHTLTLKLRPGIYTYIDNVHPIALRGKLIVVP